MAALGVSLPGLEEWFKGVEGIPITPAAQLDKADEEYHKNLFRSEIFSDDDDDSWLSTKAVVDKPIDAEWLKRNHTNNAVEEKEKEEDKKKKKTKSKAKKARKIEAMNTAMLFDEETQRWPPVPKNLPANQPIMRPVTLADEMHMLKKKELKRKNKKQIDSSNETEPVKKKTRKTKASVPLTITDRPNAERFLRDQLNKAYSLMSYSDLINLYLNVLQPQSQKHTNDGDFMKNALIEYTVAYIKNEAAQPMH